MVVLLSPIQDLPQLSGDGYGTGQHAAEGGQALTGSSSPLYSQALTGSSSPLFSQGLTGSSSPALYNRKLSELDPFHLFILSICQSYRSFSSFYSLSLSEL